MKRNIVANAFIIGLLASFAFILIQPLFGMTPLTSRHAAAYINYGQYGEMSALGLSWLVHISVSVCYALLSAVIFAINRSLAVSVAQILILGWITTLIATPANEWVVKLVTSEQFSALSSLSALNTEMGPKLGLHIVFFALVIIGLYSARKLR